MSTSLCTKDCTYAVETHDVGRRPDTLERVLIERPDQTPPHSACAQALGACSLYPLLATWMPSRTEAGGVKMSTPTLTPAFASDYTREQHVDFLHPLHLGPLPSARVSTTMGPGEGHGSAGLYVVDCPRKGMCGVQMRSRASAFRACMRVCTCERHSRRVSTRACTRDLARLVFVLTWRVPCIYRIL